MSLSLNVMAEQRPNERPTRPPSFWLRCSVALGLLSAMRHRRVLALATLENRDDRPN